MTHWLTGGAELQVYYKRQLNNDSLRAFGLYDKTGYNFFMEQKIATFGAYDTDSCIGYMICLLCREFYTLLAVCHPLTHPSPPSPSLNK